ncbi:MAG: lipoyl(octanoyl) transferase LipB [Candidatus Methylomirabilis sp.]|nr:lipoyl(octanoyl) transferase LipB [Candidatus Methylomirabilis sp.]
MRTCSLIDLGRVPYADALTLQRRLATLRAEGSLGDILLLVEHPPVVTLGRAGQKAHLRCPESILAGLGIEFFEVERGGDITYHGPGQLIGYPILNLTDHGRDVHRYLRRLEEVLTTTLGRFKITAGRSSGRTGVWVGERKIASLGIHIGRWITRHGFALNVDMDLTPFGLIVPCGIQDVAMTSMAQELSRPISMCKVTDTLVECFETEFGVSVLPISLTEPDERRTHSRRTRYQ